jgi:sugar transferase (PEP-CTERM system associated)
LIRLLHVYYPTRTVLLLLCELALVSGCFFLATWLLLGPDAYIALFYDYGLEKIGAITLLVVILSYYFDLYEPQIVSLPVEIYFRLLLVVAFTCFILGAAIFIWPKFPIGPEVYALSLGLMAPVLIFWRRLYEAVANLPMFRERVYVLGNGELARSIVEAVRKRRDLGMEIVGWRPADPTLSTLERRALWVEDLVHFCGKPDALHRIIVALEEHRNELPVDQLLNCRFSGIEVEEAGGLRERLSGKIQLAGLRASSLLFSQGFRVRRTQQALRHLVAGTASGILLLLFLPFFPFVVLAIKTTSDGPVFFRQTRIGRRGRPFHVYKFRSMRTDAEAAGAKWAVKNDPRVTGFGMFMRKTRVDEIPQLWNVLRGDMGLVGPRPERPEFIPMLKEALPFYELRHLIRPGLTGWAQVRYGYGATLEEAREKLEYDLYYIKHMTLGLDLLIMFETIKTIIRRRGAQ